MRERLCRAIRAREIIEVTCKGLLRRLEPYLVFESKSGDEVLHSWQIGGDYEKSPPPDWCNLRVKDIEFVHPTGDYFMEPQPGYNPNGRGFHRVLCQT